MSKTFAILSGDLVTNIITAESVEYAELVAPGCVEYTPENPAFIGWAYNAETGEFTFPTPAEEPAPAE